MTEFYRIGLLAPSAPTAGICPLRYNRAKQELRRLGFEPIETTQTTRVTGFTAGSGKERAWAVHELVDTFGVDAIMATIGGYNSNDMLPFLEFSKIPESLVFLGYSDATVLLHALYVKSGVKALHAPMLLPQLGEYGGIHPYTWRSLSHVLRAYGSGAVYQLPQSLQWTDEYLAWDSEDARRREFRANTGWIVINSGSCEGVLVPGNVNTLVTLTGTEYIETFSNPVLFLEDVESETPGAFKRNLQHLSLFFGSRVQGVVVGRFSDRSMIDERMLTFILKDVFPEVPVIANVDFGHTDPMLTLPVGAPVYLETESVRISVTL